MKRARGHTGVVVAIDEIKAMEHLYGTKATAVERARPVGCLTDDEQAREELAETARAWWRTTDEHRRPQHPPDSRDP